MSTRGHSASLARTALLYERVKAVIPPIEWAGFASDIGAILDLKHTRNAVVLAHNYQTPEIFHCVADIVGDSLALAREAMKVDAQVIAARRRIARRIVEFMAISPRNRNVYGPVSLENERLIENRAIQKAKAEDSFGCWYRALNRPIEGQMFFPLSHRQFVT